MLVVPGLTWPILFGNNHLAATDATVSQGSFWPSIIKLYNPMSIRQPPSSISTSRKVPSVASDVPPQPQQQPTANVTCLVVYLHRITRSPLHRGLNLVSVCLLLTTTSILASTMRDSNFWLEGKQVASGTEVLSGSINFHDLPYNLALCVF